MNPDLGPAPERGFALEEFEQRCARAQAMMHEWHFDIMLMTREHEVRYFTGFQTQFWLSPTRPWFLLLPLVGKPIAVVPTIGEVGMRNTWVDDVRCWAAPQPEDDGISLLVSTINELPRRFGRLGLPLGAEARLRMPPSDFMKLSEQLHSLDFGDCGRLLQQLFSIKSEAEVAKIRYACQVAGESFSALPGYARVGDSERDILRKMRVDLLQRGADHTPFIVSASGAGGYDNIIMGPTDRIIETGDILIIDTGTQYDGYYCDFDRNYAFGKASDATRRAYDTVYRATDAGMAAARPGATTGDLWRAMWQVLEAGGATGNSVGHLGHGLGMQLTEWPSNTQSDQTRLEPGMVMTLEPGMNYGDGLQMVHEENIVITESGAEMLTPRAEPEITVVE